MSNDKNNAAPDLQPAELAEQQGVSLPPLPRTHYNACGDGSEPLYTAEQMDDYARAALAATGKQQGGEVQGDAPLDVTDPWRGLYLPASMPAPSEYGDLTHPDIPLWPDEREDALDKLVHAQGFDFHIVAGDFTEAALEDGDDLYWQEMRAWNPEAPEGEWRLAWKGDTEDGPYAWFVRPMALRPDTAAPPAQGIDLGQLQRYDLDEGFDHYRGLPKDKGAHLYEDATGDWVKWDDVQTLIDQRDAAPGVGNG